MPSMSYPRDEPNRLAGVPTFIQAPVPHSRAPLVIAWHGFGPPGREREAFTSALPLRALRAWKLYPDLPLFGARASVGGLRELAERQRDDYLLRLLAPVAEEAAAEVPLLVRAAAGRWPVDLSSGIGLVGYSAGGAAVALALLEASVPVRAAVFVNAIGDAEDGIAAVERALGTQYRWGDEARRWARRLSLRGRIDEIAQHDTLPAILIVHGAADQVISPHAAERLYETLRPLYADAGSDDRLRLELIPDMGHDFASAHGPTGFDLDALAGGWLARYLRAEGSASSDLHAT